MCASIEFLGGRGAFVGQALSARCSKLFKPQQNPAISQEVAKTATDERLQRRDYRHLSAIGIGAAEKE